ncbi:hypothetical protein [Arthrobacter sp.]
MPPSHTIIVVMQATAAPEEIVSADSLMAEILNDKRLGFAVQAGQTRRMK